MTRSVELATKFFLVLTLMADAAVVGAVVLVVAGRVARGPRALLDRVVDVVGPSALGLAWLVAAVATAGSLYYSEVAHFAPCLLCWYQRICMYPLVAVLGMGLVRRDHGVRWAALPLVVVGPLISAYHFLIERRPSLGSGLSCSVEAPCTVPWFTELGFISLAWMALSAFLLVGVLLAVDAAYERASPLVDEVEAPRLEEVRS
ncbi:MAG: disulfide bond formation protein B [Acidimicrobiia bacterium]|nr:disulfide bond formation protein B [Acidimicrobiia bacterium]